LADYLELRTGLGISRFTAFLAAAQECAGATADALETVERALKANPDEIVDRPETLRLRGVIQLKLGQEELAEADFRNSLADAQSMGAKAWELRTTISLARLLRDTGRRATKRAQCSARSTIGSPKASILPI
jgi:hypothetical protein